MFGELAVLALLPLLRTTEVPHPSGLPAPSPTAVWADACLLHFLSPLGADAGRVSEGAAMLDSILTGRLGPGLGWFHPSQSRLGWSWLAARLDANRDGRITLDEFTGSTEWFERLDRDGDGVLTAADFDFSPRPPPKAPAKGSKDSAKEAKNAAKGGDGMPSQELLLKAMFRGELGSPYEGARVGKRAPRFTLPTHDGKRQVALADHIGKKPVVLIFGSFT
jgi:hypothetical protein